MGDAPTVSLAKVTDPAGNVLFISKGEANQSALEPAELKMIPLIKRNEAELLHACRQSLGMRPAHLHRGTLRGFAWVYSTKRWMHEQLDSILRSTIIFGAFGCWLRYCWCF